MYIKYMISVLIVEDEKSLASALSEKLSREGFDVSVESTGENVFKILKKNPVDIVLLDLVMPKKTGFKVLEELEKDPEVRMIPVIVLSGLSDDESIKKALRLGAVDYFVKTNHPISEVVEKIKAYISKSK